MANSSGAKGENAKTSIVSFWPVLSQHGRVVSVCALPPVKNSSLGSARNGTVRVEKFITNEMHCPPAHAHHHRYQLPSRCRWGSTSLTHVVGMGVSHASRISELHLTALTASHRRQGATQRLPNSTGWLPLWLWAVSFTRTACCRLPGFSHHPYHGAQMPMMCHPGRHRDLSRLTSVSPGFSPYLLTLTYCLPP